MDRKENGSKIIKEEIRIKVAEGMTTTSYKKPLIINKCENPKKDSSNKLVEIFNIKTKNNKK